MSHRHPPNTHRADAKALLDDRGYSGPTIRGQNPALLFEKGVRDRITESYYWKEQCFGLNAATLCDRAAELSCVGGTYGDVGRPTPFLCLAFKLCQLVPEREVVLEYLDFEEEVEDEEGRQGHEGEGGGEGRGERQKVKGEFKYLRALAAFYIRLAWEPVEIYKTLEPLLADYRKLKRRTREGFRLTYMDEFVDELLTKERVCATSLWKLTPRSLLEDEEKLEPRVSALGEEIEMSEDEGEGGVNGVSRDGEGNGAGTPSDRGSPDSRRSDGMVDD